MAVTIPAEKLLAAIRADWPREYEISALRLLTVMQDERISELEKPASAEPALIVPGKKAA